MTADNDQPSLAAPFSRIDRWCPPCPRSLRGRIALLIIALFLITGASITFIAAYRLKADIVREVLQQQLDTTTFIARDIGSKLALRKEGLEKVAANIPQELLQDQPALQRWLEERRAIYTLFPTGLMIVPADGGPLLAQTPVLPNRPQSFTDRDWFIGATATRHTYFSKPLKARATSHPSLAVATPLYDRGQHLLAVVLGVTPLDTPGFLDQIITARPGRGGTYELMAPRDNAFVTGTDPSLTLAPLPLPGQDPLHDQIAIGHRGVGIERNAQGAEELVTSVDVPHVGWVLTARLPAKEALAPANNAVRNTVLLAMGIGLPLLLLLLWAVNRLMAPLAALANQLQGMAEGTHPAQPLPVPPLKEIARVATSFNQLQHKLAAQEAQLAAMARRDALTGLANRDPLTEKLEAELAVMATHPHHLALLFLDLDGFKTVNDRWGHDMGDRVLQEVALRLCSCVRREDMVVRQGGDEFIIVLTDIDTAHRVAERIAQGCLDAIAVPFLINGQEIHIGVSIGIACVGPEGRLPPSVATLIRQADTAMYQAKQAGRNRYQVATSEPGPETPGPDTPQRRRSDHS